MSTILLILIQIVFALFFSCYSEKCSTPVYHLHGPRCRRDPRVAVRLGSGCVKIRFIATEHPWVGYYNPKHLLYANLTAQRYGRKDPFYYVGLNLDWKYEFHNNVTVSFYFYEFLTNRYKRGFVEMHWKMCDLIHKDKIFGPALKQGKFDRPCPFPAGPYILSNMTIPIKNIPANFPFKKGRIYCNLTTTAGSDHIVWGHIDMEIKEARTNARNWVDKE